MPEIQLFGPFFRNLNHLVLLPDGRGQQVQLSMSASIIACKYYTGDTKYNVRSRHISICQTEISSKVFVTGSFNLLISTQCPWLDAIVFATFYHTIKRLIHGDSQELYTRMDPGTHQDIIYQTNSVSSMIINIVSCVFQNYHYIQHKPGTCNQSSLCIHQWHEAFCIYLVEQECQWKSDGQTWKYELSISTGNISCTSTLQYQPRNFMLCSYNFLDLTPFCQDYLEWNYHKPICYGVHCYQWMPGGQLSWTEAKETCSDIRGTLLTLNSYEEIEVVSWILRRLSWLSSEFVFLGLYQNEVSVCKLIIVMSEALLAKII